jgi:putative transposase
VPAEAAGKPVEIWFTDEARVGQQGTITRIWAQRGCRPRAPRDRRYEWAYLFGAVCPERSTGAAIIMPEVNVAAMNEHLAEISRCVSIGAIAVLVLDGAGWHNSPRLKVPDNVVLLPLPPYSPELNPVENVWEYLRGNFLSHRVWQTYDDILKACAEAWNKFMAMPASIASITRREWAKPVIG